MDTSGGGGRVRVANMFEVFISHSSKDKLTADAVCAILEQRGIRCWIAPRDITPGVEWGEAILMGIETCSIMVLVFSANANASPQVRREVERAVHKGLIVVPLRIEDILPAKSMEYFLSNVHWLDAFTPPMTAHIERLADRVLGLLGREYEPEQGQVSPASDKSSAPTTPSIDGKALGPRMIGTVKMRGSELVSRCMKWFSSAKRYGQTAWQRVLRVPRRTLLIGALTVGGIWWATTEKDYTEMVERYVAPPNTVQALNPLAVTKDAPWTNSLGMKFVPSGTSGVLMSVWETRVQDYEAFVIYTNRAWEWEDRYHARGPSHPAIRVSWQDAVAFCDWLSKKEGKTYRLPTDAEWSAAVGLTDEQGATPQEKDGKAPGFPWGASFPPMKNAGNLADETLKHRSNFQTVSNYYDGFGFASPVGRFAPNRLGIYDLSGNVWEWCSDPVGPKYGEERVVRGAGFNDFDRLKVISSRRMYHREDSKLRDVGFRCVVDVSVR